MLFLNVYPDESSAFGPVVDCLCTYLSGFIINRLIVNDMSTFPSLPNKELAFWTKAVVLLYWAVPTAFNH